METSADYQSAVARLEEIQKAYYDAMGVTPEEWNHIDDATADKFWRMIFDKFGFEGKVSFEDFKRETNAQFEAGKASPTKYENPQWYTIIRSMVGEIEKSMELRNIISAKRPLFGTVPSGKLNGVAIGIDNQSHHLILLEDGLFGFANLFCKVIAQALPLSEDREEGMIAFSSDVDEVRVHLRENHIHVQRLADLLVGYVVLGHPHRAKPYLPNRTASLLWRFYAKAWNCS